MSETSSSMHAKSGEQKPRRAPRRMKAAVRCRSSKFHENPFGSFCVKLLAERQTDKQRQLRILFDGGNDAEMVVYDEAVIIHWFIVTSSPARAAKYCVKRVSRIRDFPKMDVTTKVAKFDLTVIGTEYVEIIW